MRLDHNPANLCFSGSGLPKPLVGSSERSISLISLRKALCKILSVSRICSYASQVLPSNTSDLIQLLCRGRISFPLTMRRQRLGYLLHKLVILQNIKGFLFPFPIFGTEHNKVFARSARDSKRLMFAESLFYQAFQVIPELVDTHCIHKIHHQLYGNAVQDYTKSPDKALQRDLGKV